MKANIEKDAVPDGWQGVRLGDVGEVVMGQSPPGEVVVDWDGDELDVDGLPFVQGNAEFGTKYPAPLKWCLQPCKVGIPGDILISVRAPVGETNRVATQLGIGRGLAAVRFEKESQPFGWHVLNRSKSDLDRVTQGSTFAAIGGGELRNLPILLPPLPEQRAIAAVLDSIDDAIEGAEAVIAATEGLRDALLHDLLTRGLPGQHTEFRDVPGLGTIPADWDVVRLGDVAEVRNGTTPSRRRPDYWGNEGVPFVKTGQVNDIYIVKPEEFITPLAMQYAAPVIVPEGSVLIAMIGQGKTRGMAAKLGFRAAINQNFAAVYEPQPVIDLDYFFAWASQNYALIRALGQGSNQDALNCEVIQGMKFPLPSQAEQFTIAAALDGVDAAIEIAREEVAGLRLLKKSTAGALLTGRVRVKTR